MDFQGLTSALARTGSTISIGTNTLPGTFADFLAKYYLKQGKEIRIDDAEVTQDEENGAFLISGRADFFPLKNLPVAATLSLDAQGNVGAVITYTLRDKSGSMSAWKFSTSFPEIPPLLDTLSLFEASLIVANRAHTDPTTSIELEEGISFLGQVQPAGLIGVLDGALGVATRIPLYGTIRVPADETDLPAPNLVTDIIATRTYPWEVAPTLPGIHLQAPIGAPFSIGNLKTQGAKWRIYSPISSDWEIFDILKPVTAVTAALDVPSAGLGFDVIMTSEVSTPSASGSSRAIAKPSAKVFVEARCSGLSIGNLAHLADITGPADLSTSVPDSLKGAVKALEKLSLTDVALVISAGTQGLYLTWASVTIGVPGSRWRLWGDHIAVEDLGIRFNISNPLSIGGSSSLAVDVFGTADIEGVPVQIKASQDSGGFYMAGRLKEKETLPLKQLMKTYLPGVPAPADITVDQLRVAIDKTGLQLAGALAQKPEAWRLSLGPGKLEVSDVIFDFTVPTSGSPNGMMRGNIGFGKDLKLAMAYTIPGSFVMRANIDKISLSQLRDTLSNQKLQLPAGFDVTLPSSTIIIEEQNASLRFQLATKIDGLGLFAFEARNVGAAWGFAAGMDLGSSKTSSLPGLKAIAAFEKMLNLEKLTLVVASYDNAKFEFPSASKFQNPMISTGQVSLPAQSGGLRAGLNVFGQWRIDANDKTQNLLAKFLGFGGTLDVTLQVATDNLRLFVRRDAKIMGLPMFCEFGLMASYGPTTVPTPSWYLTGSIQVKIQGQLQTFDTTMAFVPTGAFMSATMKGTAPVDFKAFKLGNLALQIGVNWGGVPSLGIAATIDVKTFQSSIAIMIDSTNPANSLVAGSVSDLSLKDVADTLLGGIVPSSVDEVLKTVAVKGTHQFKIAGDLTDELDNRDIAKISTAFSSSGKIQIPGSSEQVLLCIDKKGSAWHLTDLTKMRHYALVKRGNDIEVSVETQFYFAPQRTMIGTITFPQGYYLNGAIEFFGFHASATIDIVTGRGFSAFAEMDKIVILDEKLFSITAMQGGGGPKISVSTLMQPDNPVEKFRLPHFYINGSLTLLGLKQGVYANASIHGIEFEIVGNLVPGVHFDLDARFGKAGFGASGKVKVGVGTVDLGPLGKAKINTDIEVEIDIDIDEAGTGTNTGDGDSDTGATIEMESELQFAGQQVKIAKFKIRASADTFTKLPSIISKKVEDALKDVFKDMTKWTNAVGSGVMEGVNDTAKVFKDVYGKSEKEAKALANGMNKGVNQATHAVENTAKDIGKETTKTTKKVIKKVKLW